MDNFDKYLNFALRFLSYRPRSEKEVVGKLKEKKAPQEIIERVLIQLKDHKFLNDEDFARWFIENRLRFNPKGFRVIKMELKQKGVDTEIIDQAIGNLQKEIDGEVPNSDLESARVLVEKKLSRYKGLEKQEIYNKLGAFLARRGFGWDVIKKSIDLGIDESLEDKV